MSGNVDLESESVPLTKQENSLSFEHSNWSNAVARSDANNVHHFHFLSSMEMLVDETVRRLDDNEAKFAGLMGNDSEWYFTGAKLFPNVKGCGYPPMLNCSIFYRQYAIIGQNFSCYYSKVDPGIVISDLDMWQVSLQFSIFPFLLL